jgi:hypothetical protein
MRFVSKRSFYNTAVYKLGPAGYNGLKDLAMWPEGYFLDKRFHRPNVMLHLDGKTLIH